MAIRVFNASTNGAFPNTDIGNFSCNLAGDGSSTSVHLNLSKTPFDFKFDNVPSEVDVTIETDEDVAISSATVSEVSGDVVVTVTLSAPLSSAPVAIESTGNTSISATLVYNG